MHDFFDRMTERASAAYGRMRREVLASLDAADTTIDRTHRRVIDLPEDGRPAEEAALAHELSGAIARLRAVHRSLHGMSSIRGGGMERTTRRGRDGSIAVETTMSHEVTDAQRERALVLMLDGTAEWSGISGAWKIVSQPGDQQLGSVVGEVMVSLLNDCLIQLRAPCHFKLTICGRAAAELAMRERVVEKSA